MKRTSRVVQIDPHKKELEFADGSGAKYEQLISTLPLNQALELTALSVDEPADPFTAVLVLNIGAVLTGRGLGLLSKPTCMSC